MQGTGIRRRHHLWDRIVEARYIYLLILPGVIWFAVWCHGPMYGLLLAFKKYNASLGILHSPWVGLSNFERIFITPAFGNAFQNTCIISFSRILFEFPAPILLAIIINEMRARSIKRIYQTIYTFPNFLSWVIVSMILESFLSNSGSVNSILAAMGRNKIDFLANKTLFRPLLYLTSIWKSAGWSSIIYMAVLMSIDPQLYEAAEIDGASRLRRIWHITLPGLKGIIVIQLILSIGGVMNGGFDQIFNMYNPVVKPVSDIIDTYVYAITFETAPNYGFSTAVGMFKSIINFALLLSANYLSKLINGSGLFR